MKSKLSQLADLVKVAQYLSTIHHSLNIPVKRANELNQVKNKLDKVFMDAVLDMNDCGEIDNLLSYHDIAKVLNASPADLDMPAPKKAGRPKKP